MSEALHYDDKLIERILKEVKTIAAVGLSANDMRPSYFAALYLKNKGYRVIPVNPRYAGETILGEVAVATLFVLTEPNERIGSSLALPHSSAFWIPVTPTLHARLPNRSFLTPHARHSITHAYSTISDG